MVQSWVMGDRPEPGRNNAAGQAIAAGGFDTIAAMVVLFQMRNLSEQLANNSLDAAIAIGRPVQAKSVRLVAIDDRITPRMFHARSPLNRKVMSNLLAAVAQGHPSAIVDLDTSDASFADLDLPQVPAV